MNDSTLFQSFLDLPVSPFDTRVGEGNLSKSVSMDRSFSSPSRVEVSLLRSSQKISPKPRYSPMTHTFTMGDGGSRRTGGRRGSPGTPPPPPNNSNLIAAAKLIDHAQKEVDLARALGRKKDAEIASLSDLLNRSMARQNSLEDRLQDMNARMLGCLSMKNDSQQHASQATHECRLAKAYSIEYMKRMEAAERTMDEERATRKLVELRLLRATKELEKARREKVDTENDAREMVLKNEGLERYGRMLEGEKERMEGEVKRWKEKVEEAEIKEARGRTTNAQRLEEVNMRCIQLQEELAVRGASLGGGGCANL